MSRTVGSVGTALLPVEGPPPPLLFSETLTDVTDKYVRDGWFKRDVRYRSLPVLKRDGVATDLDFALPEDVARHPYWQELLAPHGLQWFAGLKVGFGNTLWCLSIQRTAAQGPFTREETQLLARLSPHVSAAGAVSNALRFARIDAALAAFEASSTPIVLFDLFGAVAGVNPSAETLLGRDLQISEGRVTSFRPEATAALASAVIELLWRGETPARRAVIPLPRRHGPPLLGYLSRPEPGLASALGSCRCLLTLVDPSATMQPVARDLELAFGLTKAEAQMAALLGAGETIETAARSRNISYDTARNQLKAIFAKLGIHRQAELAVMVTALTVKLGK